MTTIPCMLARLLAPDEEPPQRAFAAAVLAHRAACPACQSAARNAAALREELSTLRSTAIADGTAVQAAIRRLSAIETDHRVGKVVGIGIHSQKWWLGAAGLGIAGVLLATVALRPEPTPLPRTKTALPAGASAPLATGTAGVTGEQTVGARTLKPGQMRMPHDPRHVSASPLRNDAPTPARKPLPNVPGPLPETFRAVTNAVTPPVAAGTADDLAYINAAESGGAGRWTALAPQEAAQLEAQLLASVQGGDDFVEVPLPRLAATGGEKFAATALAHWRQERQIVDARLQRKVSLAAHGMAFSDLCRKLSDQTGISFTAGRDVADDKVTLFCTNRPLRDILRQITVIFNFAWERTGAEGEYAYKLKQPLKAGLLEEELRNRDRDEALLALDREMDAYRELLNLSPEEAKQRAASATGEEKRRLEALARYGWGGAQLYSRFSAADLTALRDGQRFDFSTLPTEQQMPLPPDLARNILISQPDIFIIPDPNGNHNIARVGESDVSQGVPATQFGGAHAQAAIWMDRSEAGEFRLMATSGVAVERRNGRVADDERITMATGISPSRREPKNAEANAAHTAAPEMKRKVSIVPKIACRLSPPTYASQSHSMRDGESPAEPDPVTTTADLLEAIHQATGLDVIGDYYTCLYPTDSLTAREMPLFAALNQVTDAARLRWNKEGGWLGFRTLGFFNQRPKEIPNRLLEKWAASRKRNGALPVEDFMEIGTLSDVQMGSQVIADGVRGLYGLEEWDLARGNLRPHWKLLASLPAYRRRAALTAPGIAFNDLPPNEQQAFFQAMTQADVGPDALPGAALRIEYLRNTVEATPRSSEGPTLDSPKPVTLRIVYILGGPFAGKRETFLEYNCISRRNRL